MMSASLRLQIVRSQTSKTSRIAMRISLKKMSAIPQFPRNFETTTLGGRHISQILVNQQMDENLLSLMRKPYCPEMLDKQNSDDDGCAGKRRTRFDEEMDGQHHSPLERKWTIGRRGAILGCLDSEKATPHEKWGNLQMKKTFHINYW